MTRTAVYARFSTESQDKTSIGGQFANCEALADREGFEIVARFEDEGQSGNDDSRPGYLAMLEALQRGDFEIIIADETSRISRNQAELHRLVAELRFCDQYLITCDGIDTRSESSELVLSVKAAIDAMEGRKIGYRTYRSLRERHKAGYCAGGRIYGYAIEETGDYKRRVVVPEQAEIVREIFERYAAGEGAKTIARDLNARGIPSPGSYWNRQRANGWVNTTIAGAYSKADGILRNPIYAGSNTWNKRKGKKRPGTSRRVQTRRPTDEWITVLDESLRIVSDELWNRVQTRLEAARKARRGGGRPARYLLSGVLKCGCCGGSYVMANDRNYRCSSHTNGRDAICSQKRVINREKAEDRLLSGIKEELLAPATIRAMAKQVRSRLRSVDQPDKAKLTAELQRVETQLENVVDTIARMGGSQALMARVEKLEAEKARIESEIMAAVIPIKVVPNVEKIIRQKVEALESIPRDKFADADLADRARAAVRDLIGSVKIVEDGEHVVAEVDFGRAYITHGAQERT